MRNVFNMDRKATLDMVVGSIRQSRELAHRMQPADIRLEFSPEEFTDTDLDFALELCEAVVDTWGDATEAKPVILNLPATVERRPPNQYADMIELFCRRFSQRDKVLISLHSHNDQGMAVAATQLALQAGADRVEGALFGHGERTGNVDLVTVALNLQSANIETGLDFSDLPRVAETVERLTGLAVHYRQPYAGEYTFTAFSGSHQDAIRKGLRRLEAAGPDSDDHWKAPYLHIDPADVGRKYESLIRITTQSGKGGDAWVLEHEFGIEAPKQMHPEIGAAVQQYAEQVAREVSAAEVYKVFTDEFVDPQGPYELVGFWPRPDDEDPTQIHGEIHMTVDGESKTVTADGNGPISAFVHGMHKLTDEQFVVDDYHEQAVGKGADAKAVAYVPLKFNSGQVLFGVGSDTNIDQAAVHAIVAGLNRKAKANGEK